MLYIISLKSIVIKICTNRYTYKIFDQYTAIFYRYISPLTYFIRAEIVFIFAAQLKFSTAHPNCIHNDTFTTAGCTFHIR